MSSRRVFLASLFCLWLSSFFVDETLPAAVETSASTCGSLPQFVTMVTMTEQPGESGGVLEGLEWCLRLDSRHSEVKTIWKIQH